MPAGPIGSSWASGSWLDTAWEAGSWADVVAGIASGPRIQVKLSTSPSTWTDVSEDVSLVGDLPTWSRGIPGGGPLDTVAAPGQLTFALNNHATNSGGILGWYSPASTDCRSGWGYGLPVRVVWRLSGVDYVRWTGKIRVIDPVPGVYGPRRVLVTAYDIFSDLAETNATSIPPQVDQTENVLLQAVFDALPTSAQPSSVSYDASLDTYGYALYDAATGTKGLTLIENIAQSARLYAYQLGNGTVKIENRQARRSKTSSFDFDDDALLTLESPSDTADVASQAISTIHPPTIGSVLVNLYAATAVIAVGAGETVEFIGNYSDPSNNARLIGGTGQETSLLSGTDYAGNSAADGSGTDQSADLAITVSAFAASAAFSITNTGAATVYLVDGAGASLLHLRGYGVYDNAPADFQSASQAIGRPLKIDLKYQDDAGVAQGIADLLFTQYSQLANRVRGMSFETITDPSLLAFALSAEIGDIGMVSETVTGIDRASVAIHQIEESIIPGSTLGLRVRYVLAPVVPTQDTWELNVTDHGELGVETVLAAA